MPGKAPSAEPPRSSFASSLLATWSTSDGGPRAEEIRAWLPGGTVFLGRMRCVIQHQKALAADCDAPGLGWRGDACRSPAAETGFLRKGQGVQSSQLRLCAHRHVFCIQSIQSWLGVPLLEAPFPALAPTICTVQLQSPHRGTGCGQSAPRSLSKVSSAGTNTLRKAGREGWQPSRPDSVSHNPFPRQGLRSVMPQCPHHWD